METTDVGATRASRDAPGEETKPTTRGHADAEVASQHLAQSLVEYRQGQLKGTVKYKRGLSIQRKKMKMAMPKKIERACTGLSSSEESEGEPIEVIYNIQGEAAGAHVVTPRSFGVLVRK